METMTQRHSTKSHEMCHKRALQTLSLLNFYANILKKKNILNIKRGDLQITPLFWFVDRVPKKSSAIFGCNKTHALKTHRWGHKKSPGRFGGSEGVVPHCNLVGCGSLRWLESVSESRTSQKVVRHWKRGWTRFLQAVLVISSCLCYFI